MQIEPLIAEMRKGLRCLHLEVSPAVANDVADRVEAVLAAYKDHNATGSRLYVSLLHKCDALQQRLEAIAAYCRQYAHAGSNAGTHEALRRVLEIIEG